MPAEFLLAGDFNAKSQLWGSTIEDRRGEMLGDMMATLGLTALNEKGVPTFIRGNTKSTIDITAVSEGILKSAVRWMVLDDEPMSPHRFISFEIERKRETMKEEWKWRWGPINREKLADALKRLGQGRRGTTPEDLMYILKAAYRETTRRIKGGKTPYWWTAEIGDLRAETLRLRRKAMRRRDDQNAELYKEAKKNLCKAIKASKRMTWRQLLDDLNQDVYGEGFKIVTKKMKVGGPRLTLTREEEEEHINSLFPVAPVTNWMKDVVEDVPLFTREEIMGAALRLKGGRAPGPDRVPPEVIKIAVKEITEYMLRVYNELLRRGVFPKRWKTAKVILLEKPKKGEETVTKYRPVCLLDTAGKLYEIMLNARIVEKLEITEGGLSKDQHGFRKRHSTGSAVESVLKKAKAAHREHGAWCLLTVIDVKNAFNTARWPEIVKALYNKGIAPYLINIIKDYLADRKIETATGFRRVYRIGVPQGSVLGPTLWNVMYDGIFGVKLPQGVSLVGYADDIAVVSEDKKWEQVKEKATMVLESIGGWLTGNGLRMAPEKTEMVALKFGRRVKEGKVQVAVIEVELGQSVKYLGVVLDTSVSFGPHVRAVVAKAQLTVTALSKLMPNIGGPGEAKRRALAAVGESILLYAAPIWAGAVRVVSYRQKLQSVQRKFALRVCRGYRTVSYDSAVVMASMIPIHLLVEERRRIWERVGQIEEIKKEERARTLIAWQEEWDRGQKGRWTRKLIQNIELWTQRKYGQVGYHLTQWLSGHGSFRTYKKRIGKTQQENCPTCGERDTAEHAIFECPAGRRRREEVAATVGEGVTADNVIKMMLRSRENWDTITGMIIDIIKEKELEDRSS